MFTLGWLHDIGYEFSEKYKGHPSVSADLLRSIGLPEGAALQAIEKHGHYVENKTDEWRILNMADMLIDSKGNPVTPTERLDGIKERYGEHSDQYLTACDICYQTGLTSVNFAENIT
jgi:HD superfamily phosphodiesterase